MSITSNEKFDLWLTWHVTERCNMDCTYCFNNGNKLNLPVSPVDVDSAIKTLDQTGKKVHVTLCGCECFLVPNILEVFRAIAERHYVSVVTNLTSPKIEEFARTVDPEKVLFVVASFHLDELINRNLVERFLSNYNLLMDSNFKIKVHSVAYPGIDKTRHLKYGFPIKFLAFFGDYQGKKYPESYSLDELYDFDIDMTKLSNAKYKGKRCCAGQSSLLIRPDGSITPCYYSHEDCGHIYSGIKPRKSGMICQYDECLCNFNEFDKEMSHYFPRSLLMPALVRRFLRFIGV